MLSEADLRRRYLLAAASCAVLVTLAIAFVDGPASSWSYAHFHGASYFSDFVRLTDIVDFVPPLAGLGLVGAAVAALFGWRPGPGGRVLIACCVATLVAMALKDELKYAFGRTWPETWINNNPSWIRNRVLGFNVFHGGQGYASFPSGHMTLATTPMAVLWARLRRLRWLWAIPIVLVAIGLYGADYHFVGDMVAGCFLGAACAAGTLALVAPRDPPLL